MASWVKAVLLIIAAVTPADAGPITFNFFSSSDCTGSAKLFKAFNQPDTLNGPCVMGYWDLGTGNNYLKPTCSASTGLSIAVYNTTGCSGAATLTHEYTISASDAANFMMANGSTDNNNEKYGKCVTAAGTGLMAASSGSAQLSKASAAQFTDIAEAAGSCSPAPAPSGTSGSGTSGSGTSGSNNSNGNTTGNQTTTVPKASTSASPRAHSFFAAQLVASAIATFYLLN